MVEDGLSNMKRLLDSNKTMNIKKQDDSNLHTSLNFSTVTLF